MKTDPGIIRRRHVVSSVMMGLCIAAAGASILILAVIFFCQNS